MKCWWCSEVIWAEVQPDSLRRIYWHGANRFELSDLLHSEAQLESLIYNWCFEICGAFTGVPPMKCPHCGGQVLMFPASVGTGFEVVHQSPPERQVISREAFLFVDKDTFVNSWIADIHKETIVGS